ncbi:MAG TPA: class I SAM-dependent methyltransferase [Gaiellaceae bacterium]|nr:class I SAM-dependent methyltransferase [Gaiellaceae bacterium]
MSELQHPDSRGFELVADVYERARPGYPQEAIDWIAERLGLQRGRTVLDLGAGTGKLTRALVKTGARVIAVEPGDAMRARLEQAVPEAESLRGSAERIPLGDRSVDAITAGQAFHWFRHDEAIPELHRVLRPGGGVALIWNSRDLERPLQQELSELIKPFVPPDRPDAEEWPRPLAESPLFGPLDEHRVPFVQHLDAELFVDRISSVSFVAAAPESERRELQLRLREVAGRLGGRVELGYVAVAYVSRAV